MPSHILRIPTEENECGKAQSVSMELASANGGNDVHEVLPRAPPSFILGIAIRTKDPRGIGGKILEDDLLEMRESVFTVMTPIFEVGGPPSEYGINLMFPPKS